MPAVVPGGRLTAAIKHRLHPLWRDLGFDELTNRGATGQIGPTTIYTRIERLGNQSHRTVDVDSGSLTASVALAYGWVSGASYLGYFNAEQRTISLEQTSFRVRLVRTSNAPPSDVTALIWPLNATDDLDDVIDDLVAAYETQAREFIDTWTDLPNAYQRLQTEPLPEQTAAIDSPTLMLPGTPTSASRIQHLVVLADLLGRNDEERDILQRHRDQQIAIWAQRKGLTIAELKEQHPDLYETVPSKSMVHRLAQLE